MRSKGKNVVHNPFVLSFDEINGFVRTSLDGSETLDEFITSIDGLLVGAYKDAVNGLNKELDADYGIDYLLMNEILNQKIEGKTYKDRIKDHDTVGGLVTLVDSEYVRVINTTRHELVKDNREIKKIWRTMKDDRVRDTHDYLEGAVRPIYKKFYTFDGDSAMYPHGFSKAENNVNCRCWCEYSYRKSQGRQENADQSVKT